MSVERSARFVLRSLALSMFATAAIGGNAYAASVTLGATGADSKIALSWTTADSLRGIQVMRDTDSNPSGRQRVAVLNGSARSYTDTTVTNGRQYWYWIKYTDAAGAVGNSNAGSATPAASNGGGNNGGNTGATCANAVPLALPKVFTGAADTCLVTAGTIESVNSWGAETVEINGVSYKSKWSNQMPARISGNYYIRYVAKQGWAHFEINGSGGTNNGGGTQPIAVTGVSVTPTSATVAVGSTTSLAASVAPSNATNKSVTWTSSNTGVATVSANGVVTGVAAGNATITARTADGGRTSSGTVTVASSGQADGRIMERLDRGIVAMNTGKGVFVSWRLLGNEPTGTAFNLYRKGGTGQAVLLNTSGPLTDRTNWTDTGAATSADNTYIVKTVNGGQEESVGESLVLSARTPARQYLPIKLASLTSTTGGTYSVLHAYVGDLDGDGEYEMVVKRVDSNRGPIVVEAYKLDSKLLWRVNLGPNIETGNSTATSPILVADFDGDGKAEVVVKTGEGSVFGDGTRIGDTNGDGKTDYNSHDSNDMYQVLSGPEFVSVLEGTTGKELARANFIERGKSTDWGDNYGHRMNFIFATVAYLDGVHPSFVMSRGDGELDNPKALTARAWNFRDGRLTQWWNWTAKNYENRLPAGHALSDFHAIRAMDVDGDGKDEISWGGFTLDSNGELLFSTVLSHGDRFIIADIDPDRPGLEQYAVQQNNTTLLGAALTDARTGEVLKTYHLTAKADVGRGEAAAIVPGQRGLQMWNSNIAGIYNARGDELNTAEPWPSLSIWWDGDLLRESFDGIGNEGHNPAIQKWNNSTGKLDRLFSIYNDGGSYAVICPYAGRPPLIGDILGDWREEVVLESADHTELRIYTTTIPTSYRMPTLMHDPAYRNTVNVKGYQQSTQVDYYLGEGMKFPVRPAQIGVCCTSVGQ
jgi:rhamnogalacturonan endolyase